MLAENGHIDLSLPDDRERPLTLVVQFELDVVAMGPGESDFLVDFPPPAEGVPLQMLKFVDFAADPQLQLQGLLLVDLLLQQNSPFSDD